MFASIAIILYLTGRFAIGSLMDGLKFGVCAVIALIHDAAFIIGLFAILGKFFPMGSRQSVCNCCFDSHWFQCSRHNCCV